MAPHIGGHRQRTIDRIHILVRLELANPLLSHGDIAQLGGVTPASFTRLKTLPLFKQIHNQYMSGVVTRLDRKVEQNYDLTRETLEFAVPVAMQALLQQAMQTKDERVRNKACNDILDRQGTFAKVRRIGLATKEQGGVGDVKDVEEAKELVAAMLQKPVTTINNQNPSINDPSITNTKQ